MTPAYRKEDQAGREPKPPRRLAYGRTLAQSSENGERAKRVWAVEKAKHLTVEPTCRGLRLGLPGSCRLPLDVHHVMPRSAGGTRGRTGPLATLCRGHHDWTERNRTRARDYGLLLRRPVEGGE